MRNVLLLQYTFVERMNGEVSFPEMLSMSNRTEISFTSAPLPVRYNNICVIYFRVDQAVITPCKFFLKINNNVIKKKKNKNIISIKIMNDS